MFFTLRGDAHKLYLKMKQAQKKKTPLTDLKEMKEIRDIELFYRDIDTDILEKTRFRMNKERHGTGIIPILVTSLPWLCFIFSKQLQNWLFQDGTYLWVWFLFVYSFLIITSIIIHYRERAWANLHIEIIDTILDERMNPHSH